MSLAWRALALLAGATLLVWPAILNGYPLVYIDTVSYLAHTIVPEPPWDKALAYGPFLHLFHWRTTLWLPLAAQGLIVSHLLWLVQRGARGYAKPGAHVFLCAALAVLSSAPWFVATLMPDMFSGVAVLCLFLLGFARDRLSRAEAIYVALLGAFAVAAHLSHLVVAAGVLAIILLVRRRAWPVLRAGTVPALAVLALLLGNWAAHGRASLSPNGAIFLLARLQADGPAAWTIQQRCPDTGWYLCAFADRLPMDSDEFLWDPDSPVSRDTQGRPRFMGSVLLAPEAREIVAATLRDHPGAVAAAMLRNGLSQLVMARVGDTLSNAHLDLSARRMVVAGFPPRELAAFDAAAQMRGVLPDRTAPFLRPHVPALLLSIPLILLAWRQAALRRDPHRLGLVLCVLAGIAANAFATGALSRPHHRYEARIIWLLPLAAAVALAPTRRSGAGPSRAAVPHRPSPPQPQAARLATSSGERRTSAS